MIDASLKYFLRVISLRLFNGWVSNRELHAASNFQSFNHSSTSRLKICQIPVGVVVISLHKKYNSCLKKSSLLDAPSLLFNTMAYVKKGNYSSRISFSEDNIGPITSIGMISFIYLLI